MQIRWDNQRRLDERYHPIDRHAQYERLSLQKRRLAHFIFLSCTEAMSVLFDGA